MFTENLYSEIIEKPYSSGARRLHIVSGFATPAMALRQLSEQKDLSVSLLVGMVKTGGLRRRDHLAFQRISLEYGSRFTCGYINEPFSVHSKTFAWLDKDQRPIVGFIGSANYTQMAFSSRQQEAVESVDPRDTKAYHDSLLSRSVLCEDASVEEIFTFGDMAPFQSPSHIQTQPHGTIENSFADCVILPLTMKRGGEIKIHEASGLNWGQRDGREPNQAYLPIPASIYKSDFFPAVGESFVVYTDDGEILHCTRAQENGKAIHTYHSNSELGRYFRRRLGVGDGKFVTLADLDAYGRRDVEICKIDDESYYLNFMA